MCPRPVQRLLQRTQARGNRRSRTAEAVSCDAEAGTQKLIAPEKPVKEKSAKEKPADRIESTAEKKERTADKKEKSSEKKEKNRLLLTEEGRKLSGELLRVEKDLYSVCMEGISDEEQKRMEKLMGKIQENMIRFMVKEVPEDEPGLETEEAGERKQ